MAIFYSDKAQNATAASGPTAGAPLSSSPAVVPDSAAGIASVEAKFALTTDMAINDIGVGFLLPARHVPVDVFITADDLDDGAALTITVAVLADDFTDIVASTNFITASTVGQAGGVARASVADGLRLAASDVDRWIGFKVAAAANPAKAGTLTLVGLYRASNGD